MHRLVFSTASTLTLALALAASFAYADSHEGGWHTLFNEEDFTGWEYPEDGPWAVIDGVIDCDPKRAPNVRGDVWTEQEYEDFVLHIDWRIKEAPTMEDLPIVEPDGSLRRDEDGEVVTVRRPNADSGIYLRGRPEAQVNIWNWPVGSGEVYSYRTNESMPAEVRAAVTPSEHADNPVGEWNTFVITMEDDRLSVILNGRLVIDQARLPDVPESGPIGLQLHGGYDEEAGEYRPTTSLVQFRNIHVKELD